MIKMQNTSYAVVFLFCTMAFFVACNSTETTPMEIGDNQMDGEENADMVLLTQSQFDRAQMQLGQLIDYSFPSSVRATGKIEVPAKNQIRVSAYAGGYVTNIDLIPGQKIQQGKILFTLENPDFVQMQQDYLEAKEQLAYLSSDYERQKTLAGENIASQKNFLKAESEYRMTLTKMEGLKKRMALLNISAEQISSQNMVSSISVFAPASGYVTEVYAMKGMYLNPTDVAVEMINTDHIHLELNVFEKDILKIKEGQSIQFRVPDASPETFEAAVHLIGKSVDEEKRVVRIHGHLEDEKNKSTLIPGMYVDAEIITESQAAKGLPESAVVSEEDKNYVLVISGKSEGNSSFEKREVSIGQRKNGFVEILNTKDFSPTEKVLIEGAFNLIGME